MAVKHPYKPGSPKQKMWQSMRIMRVFTPMEIAQTAEVSIAYATCFICTLRRAGYLKRQAGCLGPFAAHQLIRNTGPHAPRHWSKERQVYDINRGEIYGLD